MIDEPRKTELLMAGLKKALHQANVTPHLVCELAKQTPDISIPNRCNVIDVVYSGESFRYCLLPRYRGRDAKSIHVVSITHLTFNRNAPLFREIEAYQWHRGINGSSRILVGKKPRCDVAMSHNFQWLFGVFKGLKTGHDFGHEKTA